MSVLATPNMRKLGVAKEVEAQLFKQSSRNNSYIQGPGLSFVAKGSHRS